MTIHNGQFDDIESLMRIPARIKLDDKNQVRQVVFPIYHKVDADLTYVGQIPTVEHIIRNGWETSGAGLAHLRGLKNVRNIELWSHHITDEALPHLGKLTSLEQLSLRHSSITDNGLANLKELRQLKTLLLHRTGIGDSGLKQLAHLSSLEVLNLHRTRVTDAGLAQGLVHLKGLANLKTLRLWDTELGDSGVESLRQLKQLKTLLLYDTRLSKRGIHTLQSEMPTTKISN